MTEDLSVGTGMTTFAQLQYRTFLFDDDPAIRGVLEKILRRRGHEVFTFPTPARCPHHEAPECPCPEGEGCADFVITDISMPEISGLDFLKEQQERHCKCRNYAVMSGNWTEEQRTLARGLGCLVLEKPFEINHLIEWLEAGEREIDPRRKLNDWFQEKLP